jgi:superfamily II DNA or RNA helicase
VPYFVDHYHELGYPIADGDNQRGLRRAQLGAIHHIAGHFTLEQLPALTVLPTGAGKTTVLLMTAFVQRAHRVLVITPSRLVRGQVAAYFKTLHPLKEIGVVRDDLTVPRTLEVTTKITAQDDWENLRDYDVVVSTPNCISPALTDVPDPPEDLFDLLLIDEAHHSPATTWNELLEAFYRAKRALFTATPFRRDKQEIKGKLVYHYPIKQAHLDGIFGDLEYVAVQPSPGVSNDIRIAQATERTFLADKAQGYHHCVMVRTDSKMRANELKQLYAEHTELKLKPIHSGHSLRHIERAIRQLEQGELDGILCVDMLGEGFDFPRLKIAAIHAPHKSLAVTLQFIGRFARTGDETIGTAKFLEIPAEIEFEAQRLYEGGAVWQNIVANLSHSRIEQEQNLREILAKFDPPAIVTVNTDDPDFSARRCKLALARVSSRNPMKPHRIQALRNAHWTNDVSS